MKHSWPNFNGRRGGDPVHERLLQHYEVKGVPTIVFLGRDGRENKELRLVDYLPPDQFLHRMLQLQKIVN